MRQPAGKQETTVTAAKAMTTSMATGNAARRHHGTWRQPPWSLQLRLRLRSLRAMPMAALAASPLLAESLCVINQFNLLFVVNMIICTGTPTITMRPPEDPAYASGVVMTVDTLDGAFSPVEPACLFWWIT